MIHYDDLQYLCGLYVIVFLFYYGFVINRNKPLAAYDDPEYLAFLRAKLRTNDNMSEAEAERWLKERVRRKNRHTVVNIIFFVAYVLSFLILGKYLAGVS